MKIKFENSCRDYKCPSLYLQAEDLKDAYALGKLTKSLDSMDIAHARSCEASEVFVRVFLPLPKEDPK